jgi:hypothetical protein
MTTTLLRRCLAGGVLALTLALPTVASATTVMAADYLGGGTLFNFSRATGYGFTLSSDATVTSLGVYDIGGDGLTDRHEVGIFRRSDGAAIVTAFIGAGASSALVAGTVDGTRVEAVSALLMAGEEYYILANNFGTDQYVFGTGAVNYAAGVNWLGFVDSASNSIFDAAMFLGGLPGNLGPNFAFATAAVPVPATTLLVLLGLAGLAAAPRRQS